MLDNQISDNASTVRSLQSQLLKLKKEYAGMVLFAFRNQSAYSKLMFIFASNDFNQAYNPPCVFTKYATCSFPPKQNYLKLRITAGEKMWSEKH